MRETIVILYKENRYPVNIKLRKAMYFNTNPPEQIQHFVVYSLMLYNNKNFE